MSGSPRSSIEIKPTHNRGDGVFATKKIRRLSQVFSERTNRYAHKCIAKVAFDQVEPLRKFKEGMTSEQISNGVVDDDRDPDEECLLGMLARNISRTHQTSEGITLPAHQGPEFGRKMECTSELCKQYSAAHSYLEAKASFTKTPFTEQQLSVSLFDVFSMVNHSCDPNSEYFVSLDFVRVYAIKDIEPGEEITVSYLNRALPSVVFRQRMVASLLGRCLCSVCEESASAKSKTLQRELTKKLEKDTELVEKFSTMESSVEFVVKQVSEAAPEDENVLERVAACFVENYEKLEQISEQFVKPHILMEQIFEALAFIHSEDDDVSYLSVVAEFKPQIENFAFDEDSKHTCYLITEDICKRAMQLEDFELFDWAYGIMDHIRSACWSSQDTATGGNSECSFITSLPSVKFLWVLLTFVKNSKTISKAGFHAESDEHEYQETEKRLKAIRNISDVVSRVMGEPYMCYIDYAFTGVVREFLESISS